MSIMEPAIIFGLLVPLVRAREELYREQAEWLANSDLAGHPIIRAEAAGLRADAQCMECVAAEYEARLGLDDGGLAAAA